MDNITKLYKFIERSEVTAEEVANLFTHYHGNDLVSDEFIEFVEDEGYDI